MPQNRIDAQRARRQLSCVAFQRIIKIAGNNPDCHVLLFEGEDERYYAARIASEAEYSSVICNGKENLIEAYNLAKQHRLLSQMKIIGFIDKDYDANITNPDIYVTPCYSIENLYCTTNVFYRILSAEFGLCQYADVAECNHLYANVYEKFENDLSGISILSAWFRFQRDTESRVQAKKKLSVNVIDLADIFGSSSTRHIQYIKEKCPKSYKWTKDTKAQYLADDFHDDPISNYRGKWVLELFMKYLRPLIESGKSQSLGFKTQKKPTIAISGNGIASLSSYADTPECLVSFLRTHGI